MLPLGYELIHQRYETTIVSRFEQVNHFMDDDIFKALGRLLREIGVQPDAP